MEALARQVIALLELRRVSAKLAEELEHVKALRGLLPICAWCKRLRDDGGYWDQVEAYFHKNMGTDFIHSICPECLAKLKDELQRQGTASKAGRSAIGKRRSRKSDTRLGGLGSRSRSKQGESS